MKYSIRIIAVLTAIILTVFLGSTAQAQGGGLDPQGNEVVQKKGQAEVTYQVISCDQRQQPVSGTYETEINVYNGVGPDGNRVTNNDVEIQLLSTNPLWAQGSFHIATGGLATVSGGFTTENPWIIPDVPTDDWDVRYDRASGRLQGELVEKSNGSSLVAWPADLISDCLPGSVQVPEGNNMLQTNMAPGTTMEGTLTQDSGELLVQGEFFNASGSVAFRMEVTYST
ncbi:hypothetical protein [Streptomyces sp. NPDC058583]|uniref:hypothetical protein n=1 Tax=unclassified Streptomyces TaxID=2593676 RepID=UPI00365B7126